MEKRGMSAISTDQPTSYPVRRGTSRLEPLSGFAFVAFFLASIGASSPPGDNAPATNWVANYTGTGHQIQHLATGLLLVLAGLCLMAFMTGLWRKVDAWSGAGQTSPLPLVAAGVAAACIAAGGVVMATVSGSELFGQYRLPAADVLRFGNDMGVRPRVRGRHARHRVNRREPKPAGA